MIDCLGPYLLGPNDQNQGIYTGDARELARAIPDESVHLIFADPPYLREFLWTYQMLAQLGTRTLKIGSYLFAYGAGEHMPARLAGMEGNGLNYFWTFVLLHNGGWPRMWHKRLMSGYKPVFIYIKGKPKINPWMATVHNVTMDKRFHRWGQGSSFALKMIEMLTEINDIVFDPFCGGGTIPAVCKMLGRRYLAFEIDPKTAEIARRRVAQTQLPLPGLVIEQREMAL